MEHPVTYITYEKETDIKPDFMRAVSPVMEREGLIVVHREADEIRAVAEKHGQKGITVSPGRIAPRM